MLCKPWKQSVLSAKKWYGFVGQSSGQVSYIRPRQIWNKFKKFAVTNEILHLFCQDFRCIPELWVLEIVVSSSPFWQSTLQNSKGNSLTICLYSASANFRKQFKSVPSCLYQTFNFVFIFRPVKCITDEIMTCRWIKLQS